MELEALGDALCIVPRCEEVHHVHVMRLDDVCFDSINVFDQVALQDCL